MDSQYSVYKVSADSKQLEFNITKGDFMEMVVNECYYCGIIQDKGFNGIDRLDSSEGYIMSNCVSCCQMCNYMKGSLGPTIFMNRVEHIMTHLKLFQGKLHSDDFKDVVNVKYSTYKSRADKKEILFELSESEFNEKIKEQCYLCGKLPSQVHKNGLDRVDNDKGYSKSNLESCCGNCNMLKINYTYDSFIEKCKLICEKNIEIYNPVEKNKPKIIFKPKPIETIKTNIKDKDEQDKSRNTPSNKLSIDEKREKERLKKQKQRQSLRERHGDEEYKKMRAEEIANTRRNKKLNTS
jgi:hypothetical protein